jgi:YD repeat-containing protein
MEITDSLLHSLLVACDQSYDPDLTQGQALASYSIDNNGDPYTGVNIMPSSWAGDLTGWTIVNYINDDTTGFGATVYRRDAGNGTYNYIVALRGTRGLDPQNWQGNLTYGWDSWTASSGGQALMSFLLDAQTVATTNQICFTGQSLGGALAQYATYQYVAIRNASNSNNKIDLADVSLVTFNGLGAVDGLTNASGQETTTISGLAGSPYDPDLLDGVSTQYYWVTNDLVSALGGGNVNDQNGKNDYELVFKQSATSNLALDPVSAHRINQGFYFGFNTFGSDFSAAYQAPIPRINVEGMAAVGTAIANLFDNGADSEAEAAARLYAAVILGTAFGLPDEVHTFVGAIVNRMAADGSLTPEYAGDITSFATYVARNGAQASLGSAAVAWLVAQVLNDVNSSSGSSSSSSAFGETFADGQEALNLVQQIISQTIYSSELPISFPGSLQAVTNILNAYSGASTDSVTFASNVAGGILGIAGSTVIASSGEFEKLISAHASDLLQLIEGDANWVTTAISDIGQWAYAANQDIASCVTDFASWLYSEARSAVGTSESLLLSAGEAITSAINSLFESAGNAFSDFTQKYVDGTISWIEGLSIPTLRQFINESTQIFQGQGEQFSGAGITGSWQDFEDGATYGVQLGADAAQDAVVSTGGFNPFTDFNFTPGEAPTQSISIGAGQAGKLTIDLASAAGASGQKVELELSGGAAGYFDVLDQAGQLITPSSDGSYLLFVPPGSNQISFSLLANDANADSSGSALASVTVLDENGAVTHASHAGVMINYNARDIPDPTLVATPNTSGVNPRSGGLVVTDYGEYGQGYQYIGTPEGIDYFNADGNDLLIGNGGQDVMIEAAQIGLGAPTNNRIYANSEADIATAITESRSTAGTGNKGDFIGVGDGNNTIVGGDGNDLIMAGQGDNVVVMGSGNSILLAGEPNFPAADFDWTASISKTGPNVDDWETDFFDVVDRGEMTNPYTTPANYEGYYALYDFYAGPLGLGDDTIFGGSGNDFIWLSNGDNYVDLGSGDNTVLGGQGNNTVFGGVGDSQVIGGGGNDYISDGSGSSLIVGRGGNNTIFGGGGSDTIYAGGGNADWATYETGDNYVNGGSGDCVVFGSGGNDTLVGGSGNDTIYAGDGAEYVYGGAGNDVIFGGAGNDILDAAGDGNTEIHAGTGNTTIYGGGGANLIYGGSGVGVTNIIYAGNGGDYSGLYTGIFVGSCDTTVYGGLGSDAIYGGSGSDVLYAGDGGTDLHPNFVFSGIGASSLYGGAGASYLEDSVGGDDLLIAGSGDATLIGTGSDTLVAGSGDDYIKGGSTVVLNSGFGNIEIADSGSEVNIEFGDGIELGNLKLGTVLDQNGNAVLEVDSGGSIAIDGGLSGFVGEISFSDGSSIDLKHLIDSMLTDSYVPGVNGNLIFNKDDHSSLTGGAGSDTISAWGNNDTVTASQADGSQAFSGGDNSIILGGSGHTVLVASGASDTLIAGSGQTTLRAGSYGAVLKSGASSDILIGGAGDDKFYVNDSSDIVQSQQGQGNDTIFASASFVQAENVLNLTLTDSDLTATGNEQAGVLTANGDSDTLISGTGADTLIGNGDNETFIINSTSDVLQFGAGTTGDIIESSVSYTLQEGLQTLTLIGSNDLTATGNDLNDVITGNAGNDALIAGNGNATLIAGTGIDTLTAGSGNDLLEGAAGDTYVFNANFGSDEIRQGSGGTVQFGDGIAVSDLTLTATLGSDGAPALVIGDGSGNTLTIDDAFSGAVGQFKFADGATLSFTELLQQTQIVPANVSTSSGQFILSGTVNVSITGGTGNDTISAWGSDDTLTAGSGNTSIVGGGTGDILVGGEGNDTLVAVQSNETLIAGIGSSTLVGAGSDDSYRLVQGGYTEIDAGTVSGPEAIYVPGGMSLADFDAYQEGNDLLIQSTSGDTSALIKGYFSSSQTASDWLVTSDNDPPEPLANLIVSSQQSASEYANEIDGLRTQYAAQTVANLQALGNTRGTLGNLSGVLDTPIGQYTFTGVTTENETVSADTSLPTSDLGQGYVATQTTTIQIQQKQYGYEYMPGRIIPLSSLTQDASGAFIVPPGATPVYQDVPPPDDGGSSGQHQELIGFELPGTYETVYTGTQTISQTVTTSHSVITNGFVEQNVTVDGTSGSISNSGPFAGTINAGNGNVDVELGGSGGSDSGTWTGTFGPYLPANPTAAALAPKIGTFIEAGAGTDTLVGTSNNDVLAAGSGFDYMDGGSGADTYYVSMQGDSTAIINDSGTPDPQNLMWDLAYGGSLVFPMDTLVLPAGITPGDLSCRVFQDPAYPGCNVLQINYGESNVLIVYQDPVAYTLPFGNGQTYSTGAQQGIDKIQFADGTVLTPQQLAAQANQLPNDFDPTVTAQDQTLQTNQTVYASSLFSASDTGNNAVSWYHISMSGDGYFELNGNPDFSGDLYVTASQLPYLQYVASPYAGDDDSIEVSAFDGATWSNPVNFDIFTPEGGNLFQATGPDQLVVAVGSGPDTLIGGFANDTLSGGQEDDVYEYNLGDGPLTISDLGGTNTLQLGSGITSDMIVLSLASDGSTLLTVGTNGDSIDIASGSVQTLTYTDGSYSTLTTSANGNITLGNYSSGGTQSNDNWVNANGSHGNDTFNTDGSSSGNTTNADGSSSTYTNDGQGTVVTNDFDPSGNASGSNIKVTDSQGNSQTQYYDAIGQFTGQLWLNADGSFAGSEADTYGNDGSKTVVHTDSQGNVQTQYFDAGGRLTGQLWTNPDGTFAGSETDTYNSDGSKVVAHTDSDGAVQTQYFNADDQLTGQTWTNPDGTPNGSETDTYNSDGSRTVVHTDSQGNVQTQYFDANGRLTGQLWTNPDGTFAGSETDTYGTDGSKAVAHTDSQGNVQTQYFNANDQLTGQLWTNADGSVAGSETDTYNSDGSKVVAHTDSQGNINTQYFDANNLITSQTWTNPDGTPNGSETYTYNADGTVTSLYTDALGDAQTQNFDNAGNLLDQLSRNVDGTSELQFAAANSNQLWFQQSGNDLIVSVIGTSTAVDVSGWYASASNRVQTIAAADGLSLASSQVQNLVQAMAAFDLPGAGETTFSSLPQNEQDALQPVLAANWS